MTNTQAQEVVYHNAGNTARVYRNQADAYIMVELTGAVQVSDYREAFTTLLKELANTGYQKLVFNLKALSKSDPESRAWLMKKFLPQAFHAIKGEAKAAIVSPTNTFQELALQMVLDSVQTIAYKTEVKYCQSVEEATAWITEAH